MTFTRFALFLIACVTTLALAETYNVVVVSMQHAPNAILGPSDQTRELLQHGAAVIGAIVVITWLSGGNFFAPLIACILIVFGVAMVSGMAAFMAIVMAAADDPKANQMFDAMEGMYQGWTFHHWGIYAITAVASVVALADNFYHSKLKV